MVSGVRQPLQKMLDGEAELIGVLDEAEMADAWQQKELCVRNVVGHEERVLALDGLVVVGVSDHGGHADVAEFSMEEGL